LASWPGHAMTMARCATELAFQPACWKASTGPATTAMQEIDTGAEEISRLRDLDAKHRLVLHTAIRDVEHSGAAVLRTVPRRHRS